MIWDPEAETTITQSAMHNAMDYSAYEGHWVKGHPKTVLLRGKVIVEEGKYVGAPGDGRFLKRRGQPASKAASPEATAGLSGR